MNGLLGQVCTGWLGWLSDRLNWWCFVATNMMRLLCIIYFYIHFIYMYVYKLLLVMYYLHCAWKLDWLKLYSHVVSRHCQLVWLELYYHYSQQHVVVIAVIVKEASMCLSVCVTLVWWGWTNRLKYRLTPLCFQVLSWPHIFNDPTSVSSFLWRQRMILLDGCGHLISLLTFNFVDVSFWYYIDVYIIYLLLLFIYLFIHSFIYSFIFMLIFGNSVL